MLMRAARRSRMVAALEAAYAHPDGTVARLTRERDEWTYCPRCGSEIAKWGHDDNCALAQKDTP